MNPWVVLLALALVAALYVVLPVGATTFAHFRRPWRLRCPRTGREAQIRLDATGAAVAEVLGREARSIERCSSVLGMRLSLRARAPKMSISESECLLVAARVAMAPHPLILPNPLRSCSSGISHVKATTSRRGSLTSWVSEARASAFKPRVRLRSSHCTLLHRAF